VRAPLDQEDVRIKTKKNDGILSDVEMVRDIVLDSKLSRKAKVFKRWQSYHILPVSKKNAGFMPEFSYYMMTREVYDFENMEPLIL
jgi:hypothetical protein